MDRHRVDRIAVLLATSRSRRGTLRLLAAGLVGSFVASRSPGPATALFLCPGRVPDPAYVPTTNGCGPSGFGYVIPDRDVCKEKR